MTFPKLPHFKQTRKITLAISAALAFAGAAVFVVEVQKLVEQWRVFEKSQSMARNLADCLSDLKDMETGQRGFLLTGNQRYLEPFENGSAALKICLNELNDNLRQVGPHAIVVGQKITKLSAAKESELRQTINLRQQGATEDALKIVNSGVGKAEMDEIRTLVAKSSVDFESKMSIMRASLSEQLRTIELIFLGWLGTLVVLVSLVLRNMRRAEKKLLDAQEKLAFEATHDTLTGLPNRRYLMDWLKINIPRSERLAETVGVIYIDLDGFSHVNNTYGHEAGDATLVWAAKQLKDHLRASDFVSRLGGDEFVIISTGQTQDQLEQLSARLLAIFNTSTPSTAYDQGVVGLSMGIALVPIHAESADEVLRLADQAMYAAKKAGKRCYRVASQEKS